MKVVDILMEAAPQVQYTLKLVRGDPAMEVSVRGLRELQRAALLAYHAENGRLEDKINALRSKRRTKLKTHDYEPYYEPGRSRMPTPSGGMGGDW